jgi:hypothetical protein
VDPTQAKGRLEWGTQPLLGKEKQQVPPLRFAPVGMTNLFAGQVFLAEALAGTAELSSSGWVMNRELNERGGTPFTEVGNDLLA